MALLLPIVQFYNSVIMGLVMCSLSNLVWTRVPLAESGMQSLVGVGIVGEKCTFAV